jgi:hypothetical protein
MLQDLATGASTALATASLVFFVAIYALVVVRVVRARNEDLDARARMALDDERLAGVDAPGRAAHLRSE